MQKANSDHLMYDPLDYVTGHDPPHPHHTADGVRVIRKILPTLADCNNVTLRVANDLSYQWVVCFSGFKPWLSYFSAVYVLSLDSQDDLWRNSYQVLSNVVEHTEAWPVCAQSFFNLSFISFFIGTQVFNLIKHISKVKTVNVQGFR